LSDNVTNSTLAPLERVDFRVTSRWYAPAHVEPRGPTFSLAGAGSVLIGFTAACIVAGALIGWAVGKLGLGIALGAVVGIPVGVAATVLKYRNA
jgi:hypothetical protein